MEWVFSPVERGNVKRGKVKYKYSFWKLFWDLTEMMFRKQTFNTTIDKILFVYSKASSVTLILRAIRDDK